MQTVAWKSVTRGCLAVAALMLVAGQAAARIKLTTLPARQRVEIQLDNPAYTLVEEERIVTLLPGSNQVDFSWTNTAIDKGSIQFRVLDMPTRAAQQGDPPLVVDAAGQVGMIQVINVSYPPGENALVWEVFAEKAFAARVRISYVVANLKRSFSYRAVAGNDEKSLTLRNLIRVDNLSGEDFGSSGLWAGFGKYFQREIGLNEAKEMLSWKFDEVPVQKTYTFNWHTGRRVPDEPEERYVEMRYVISNDDEHNMGLFPLQRGKVRIFQKDSRGGEAFIGEDWGAFTPIDDEMKLYLGLARDVVVKRRIAENRRHAVHGNLFHQEVVLEYEIENFKNDDLTLDVVEDINNLRNQLCGGKDHDAQWEIADDGTTVGVDSREIKDSQTLILHLPLDGAPEGDAKVEKTTVRVHLWLRNEW